MKYSVYYMNVEDALSGWVGMIEDELTADSDMIAIEGFFYLKPKPEGYIPHYLAEVRPNEPDRVVWKGAFESTPSSASGASEEKA